MNKFKKHLLNIGTGLTFAGALTMLGSEDVGAQELDAASWTPRTVEEIKNDLDVGEEETTYTFQWGDTLSAIARATDLSVNKLVQINDINNANLIYAGNTIHLSGDQQIVTVEKEDEVVSYNVGGSEEEEVTQVETPEEVKETVKEKKETPAEKNKASEPKAEVKSENQSSVQGKTLTVEATAYSTNQASLSDFTFTGNNLRENPYVIAVDPTVIPLGSKVHVPGFGTYIAGDTGSAIKGNRIDIHITDLDAAWAFGRQTMEVTIVE